MGIIERLPTDVVNRMAAGEVLARPSNAVKELVENALDAGSTEIVVNLQQSGLKLLQVTDNGKGIARDDFELVCERFATSKLHKFEDLLHMKTYGFRGEALASLSHVAKVNIVSKQCDSNCAYQADFIDGKMVSATRASAGKTGTCITATDLFYNFPQRRNKMMTHNEETKVVTETLTKFAIHRPDVSFALRQNQAGDFRTKGDGNLRDVVSGLFGREIADNLIHLNLDSTRLKFQFTGCISKPIPVATAKNAMNKKIRQNLFSVFINGRSVKCEILKQPIDEVLVNKSLICQFCAVDLKIDETRVDVNVHPTKSSVLFLERDDIVEEIRNYIRNVIDEMFGIEPRIGEEEVRSEESMSQDSGKILPIYQVKSIEGIRKCSTSSASSVNLNRSFSQKEKKRVDYMEIRTDSKERKLDEFVIRCPEKNVENREENVCVVDGEGAIESDHNVTMEGFDEVSMVSIANSSQEESMDEAIEDVEFPNDGPVTKREFSFASLRELRNRICENASLTLREMFKTFTFVGSIDPETALIQFGTSLFQLDMREILREFFYQSAIFSFGNFGSYRIEESAKIVELLEFLGEMSGKDDNYGAFGVFLAQDSRFEAEKVIGEHAELLNDYFAIVLEWKDDDRLYISGIPSLVHYYVPQLEKLPFFIGALVMDVDYEDERNCFDGICKAIADLFVIHKCFTDNERVSAFSALSWKVLTRQILMPMIKKKFIPLEGLKNRNAIRQLADAHDLYKVFERCGG